MMSTTVKSRITAPPRSRSATNTATVVPDVRMVRGSVSLMDALMSSMRSRLRAPFLCRFSRMRSNTMMVSFSEYPTMVSTAATLSREISMRKIARKPSVIMMSWAVAMMAAVPKRVSKRNAR